MSQVDSDRRGFPRIRSRVDVRYKFLSSTVKDPGMETVCEGTTQDISVSGLLLVGPVPTMDWLKDLLLGHIQVGLNLALPRSIEPIKALARLSWIEAKDPKTVTFRMGLRILDVSPEHRGLLSDFLSRESMAR